MRRFRVLQVEDSESDAAMIIRMLEKAGFSIQSDRVEDEAAMKEALARQSWDAVIQLSQSWCDITGYSREELATVDDWMDRAYGDRKGLMRPDIDRLYGLEKRIVEGDRPIRTKSGENLIWEFSSAPQGRLPDGRRLVISMAMDVTSRRQAEKKLIASLEEKTILVKEIHHRVKNNLQIIVSLLNLQASGIRNAQVQDMFQTTRNRIHSMALLHETLYRSDNLARLDIAGFVKQLTSHLFQTYGSAASRIQLQCDIAGVDLSLEHAVPCGLIINELLSNALKYAFPGGRPGRITIGIQSGENGQVLLTVADDGVGLPPELDIQHADSLGLKLVTILAKQINGSLVVQRDKGAVFQIAFQGK
jgi:PAS domain S-box-containing protein